MGTLYSAQAKIRFFRERFDLMKSNDSILDENKLIAQFCIKEISTERKAKELIKMFEMTGEVKRIGKELMSKKIFEEEAGKTSTIQKPLLTGA